MRRGLSGIGAAMLALFALAVGNHAAADVAVTDVGTWKAAHRVAQKQKANDKRVRRSGVSALGTLRPASTGAISLIDSSGLEYFINTNITSVTTSSASGAASEASFTGPVAASTMNGGTTTSTLNDAFDGYNSLWFSQTLTGPAATGNAAYVGYNNNGPASLDAACGGRQVLFPNQTIYGLTVSRKVFVPSNDSFARWQTILANPTAAAITVNVISANNLGSDSNTRIDSTASGDAVVTVADNWLTSWQNWTGTTSSDPRLGHVIWGPGATVTPNAINFVDGDDNPYWSFHVTVPAGATRILLHFVTGQPTKVAARAKAREIATSPLGVNEIACMSPVERAQIVNFALTLAPEAGEPAIPALGTTGLLALVGAIAAAGLLAHRRLLA